MKSTCFVFKLKRKKQVLALILIEDLGFLPLVRVIQRLSTRSSILHSWKDGISHTRGRNRRSSIGTCVRTYYSRIDALYLGCWCWEIVYQYKVFLIPDISGLLHILLKFHTIREDLFIVVIILPVVKLHSHFLKVLVMEKKIASHILREKKYMLKFYHINVNAPVYNLLLWNGMRKIYLSLKLSKWEKHHIYL